MNRKRRSNDSARVTGNDQSKASSSLLHRSPTSLNAGTTLAVVIAGPGVSLTPGERAHLRRYKHWRNVGDAKAPGLFALTHGQTLPANTRPATGGRCYRVRRDVRAEHYPAALQKAA